MDSKDPWEEVYTTLSAKQRNVVNFLMGKIMKESGGKVDAKKAREMLIRKLSELTYEQE